MFSRNYQGGAVVEIFSAQGKDPVAQWKLSGGSSSIQKEFNKDVKGFVYCLKGSSQTVKMQMPENGKISLGLRQRFLVLQVNIPQSKDFSLELVITDSEHLKRRLHLSTVHKELSATVLHARIPFVGLKRDFWSTLCIDLVSFTTELFKGFTSLDGITLFATCKVRRIFTMKTGPAEMGDDVMFVSGPGLMAEIPRSCQFPAGLNHVTQMLNMRNLQRTDVRPVLENSDCGAPGRPLSLSPTDKQKSKKLLVHGAGGDGPLSPVHPDFVPGRYRNSIKTRENRTPPSSGEESRQRPVTLKDKTEHVKADELSVSPAKESFSLTAPAAESVPFPTRPGLSSGLQAWSSWESNEGSEPQLALQDELFAFSSQPHTPKRGQGQGDQGKMEMGHDQAQSNESGHRREAQPEDDFIGSESDEEVGCTTLQQQRTESSPSTPRSPDPASNMKLEVRPKYTNTYETSQKELYSAVGNSHAQSPPGGRPELVPTRCLSPSVTSSRQEHKCGQNQVQNGSSGATLLHEVKLDDSPQHQEEDETQEPADSSHYDIHQLGGLKIHRDNNDDDYDDEELRMLASLKREKEEEECRVAGLSASQIHQCNVSISMSSDDTSTWTQPENQGHHYQNEMNPLLHSNPREWIDVLSPPIMPPSQPRRSGNAPGKRENLVRGGDGAVKDEVEPEDEYLNLLYDPCLNCYFDPKTGKYYELA